MRFSFALLALSIGFVMAQVVPSLAQEAKLCAVAWAEADKNADGGIVADEADEATKAKFADVDTDKDGKLSQAEYEACAKM